jgi:tripartite-type tricarboxylate transporter receptor subunit TctC
MRRRFVTGVLAAAFATTLPHGIGHAQSAEFPNRTLRIVVPFTPGSGSDSASRFFGEKLTARLGQSVVVENKPGGNGLIAVQAVKDAPADGHSILLGNISLMAVNAVLLKDISYDPMRDFKPLHGLFRGAAVFVVPNGSEHKSLEDLLRAVKGGPLSMGTYSQGYRLASEYLSTLAGVKFVNVPYKGQAQLMTDLISNQLDAALLDFGGAVSMLKAGKMRALALTARDRHPVLPDIPTVREQGFPAYEHYSWVGLYVRSDTPEKIAATLSGELKNILDTAEAVEFVNGVSGELMPFHPQQMQQFVQGEIDRFRKVAATAGIEPQ